MLKLILFLTFTLLTNVIQFTDANTSKANKHVLWSTEYIPARATTEMSYLDQNLIPNQNPDSQSDNMSLSTSQEPYFEAQRETGLLDTKQQMNWSNDQLATNKFSDTIKQMAALQPMNTSTSAQWSSPIRSAPTESNHLFPQLQLQIQPQPQAINSFRDPAIDQLNRFAHLSANSNPTAHHYITNSLISRQPLSHLPHLSHADQMLSAISSDLMPRAGIPKEASFLPTSFEQLSFKHNPFLTRPQISTKSPWLKSFTLKRRSYEHPTSESQQITPRIANVNFDDSVDVTRISRDQSDAQQDFQGSSSKGLREYLTSYSTVPLVFDLPPSMEKKNMKIATTSEEDHLGSYSDGIFAVAGKSPSYTHSMPHYYSPNHYTHNVAPRKGLEKSLGLSILVGIGAALISFLIISNLFLSVPLFAMTLLQLLQGNNVFPNMQPNNNNNNNMPPNNNQNGSGPTTNGRKRRDLHEIELEEKIRKAIDKIYL